MTDMRKFFKPKSDITTWELAQIVSRVPDPNFPVRFSSQGWEGFSSDLQRHFIDGDPPDWQDWMK